MVAFFLNSAARSRSFLSRGNSSCFICIPVLNVAVHVTKGKFQQLRAILSRLRRQLLSKRSLFGYSAPKSPLYKRGGAERRQWRMQRGGSPVSKGVQGSRSRGNAARPLRIVGNTRGLCGGLPHQHSLAGGCRIPAGIRTSLSRLRRQLLSERSLMAYRSSQSSLSRFGISPSALPAPQR